MYYKFEQLDVWKLSLEYVDSIYSLAERLPQSEETNLKSQIVRAATSISLNIAEGSTGQTDEEQARSLGMAVRSLVETVACHHLIQRRGYIQDEALLEKVYEESKTLARKLQAVRRTLAPYQVREDQSPYGEDELP